MDFLSKSCEFWPFESICRGVFKGMVWAFLIGGRQMKKRQRKMQRQRLRKMQGPRKSNSSYNCFCELLSAIRNLPQ
jgi:hypothetical protein